MAYICIYTLSVLLKNKTFFQVVYFSSLLGGLLKTLLFSLFRTVLFVSEE